MHELVTSYKVEAQRV